MEHAFGAGAYWNRGRIKVQIQEIDGQALAIFQAIGDLNIRFSYETSAKMNSASVSDQRFLLGLKKRRIAGDPDARLLSICSVLGMPDDLMVQYRKELPLAQHVHFGFEFGSDQSTFKAYLEFFDVVDSRIGSLGNRAERQLVHRGFKWKPNSNEPANVTSYWWFPHLSREGIERQLDELLKGREGEKIQEVAMRLLSKAYQRTAPQNLFLLEVCEEQNDRRSFDLNFYRADLCMGDVAEVYAAALSLHGHSTARGMEFLSQVARERFGHFAGGFDRVGQSFITFYYGLSHYEPLG